MTVSQITAPDLSEQERDYLFRMLVQLDARQATNKRRIEYFGREKRLRKFGFSVPPQLRKLAPILGWPEKAVTGLALRINWEEFVVPGMPNGDDRIRRIVDENALEVEIPQAHVSALQLGPAFAFVTAGDPSRNEPAGMISYRSAQTATALWDKRSRRAIAGLSIVDWSDTGQPAVMNMYLPRLVITLTRMNSGWRVNRVGHSINEALVTPLVHDPYLDREFGSSRITQTVMDLTDMAARTMLRAEVSGEFFSSPQRYFLDLTRQQYDRIVEAGGWQSILGSVFATEVDDSQTPNPNGSQSKVGQFPQQSQEPHIAQLRSIATMFAAETSLPLNSLGIVQDNPASAEAIQEAKADMSGLSDRACRVFDFGHRRTMRQAVMVAGGLSDLPAELIGMRSRWQTPPATQIARSQAVVEQVREGILPPNDAVTYELLGYDKATVDRLVKAWESAPPSDAQRLADALTRQTQPTLPSGGARTALTA